MPLTLSPQNLHYSTSLRRRFSLAYFVNMLSSAGKSFDDIFASHDMPSSENIVFLRRYLVVLVVFAAIVFVYNSAHSLRLLSDSQFVSSSSSANLFPFYDDVATQDNAEYRLGRVLNDAATKDKTIIITTLNEAWATPGSIFDLFLESFRIGDHTRQLLNHLVIVALDDKAYKRCLILHHHCYALLTEGVDFSKEAYFMTPDYLKMMWRRIDFLRSVLELGFNFIFTDADIMWFRDPFPRFFPDADFQIACDHFSGDSFTVHNRPNGGFNYVQSNNRSIEFYKFWYESQENYPGYHDQDVLNFIKHDPFISEIGLRMRFLDTAYFGGFCEPSKDLNQVCTMHANCCFGINSKLHDLKILLQDWRVFMSLPPSLKQLQGYSWSVPQKCSTSVPHPANAPQEMDEEEEKEGEEFES